MDASYYLDIFQQAANKLDRQLIEKKHLEVSVGEYLKSVFLKLYKLTWANKSSNPLSAESRIFFSIWINDQAIKEDKIFYNIHALKLRKLHGYSITSRDFAIAFREKFKSVEEQWPNVSTNFGPLTLMQGWKKLDEEFFQNDIIDLSGKFIEINYLVDELLNSYKKTGIK